MGKTRQPAPPPAPDPRQIAQTEAEFNRIDQNTPFGSLTFSGPNRNTANLSLSPELQQLFSGQVGTDIGLGNLAQQALPSIGGLVNNPISSSLPPLQQNFDAYRGDSEKAFFDRSAGLLNEQFGRDEDRLRQTLANQGLQSGGQAFNNEFGQFNQRRGDTFSNLARDAVLYGGQEASRSLQGQMGLRNQLVGERGSQFNELASLLGLQQTQVPGLQNFFAPSQVGVGDAFALNQASQQNAFNQRSASARNAKGEVGDLLGTAISGGK